MAISPIWRQVIERVWDAASSSLKTKITSSALPSGAATESTLSSLNSKVTAVNTGNVTVSSSALPSGAATESTLSSISAKLASQLSSTPTISRVSSSATSVQILALNASRLGAVLYNDSTSACYLKFGTTASATSYTFKMDAKSTVILDESPIYTGRLDAIWDSANGAMEVTELS